jgi:hypothetical protein
LSVPVKIFFSGIFIWLTVQCSFSLSWTERQQIIGGGIGVYSHTLLDRHASPLRYSGVDPGYFVRYQRLTGGGVHDITAGYVQGELTPDGAGFGALRESYKRARFRGGYRHRLTTVLDEKIVISGGFFIDNVFTHREHWYLARSSELFVEFYSALSPVLSLRYRLHPRHSISVSGAGSTIAFVVYSPYAVRGSVEYAFEFFGSFRQAALDLEYSYGISDSLALQAVYAFVHYRHDLPKSIQFSSERIGVSLFYIWR